MILLQSHTAKQIEQFIASPSHGLLLSGSEGAGKTFAAQHISARLLDIDALEKYPYLKLISPEKNSLSIDQVRELQKFLQLKTPGNANIRRIAIIEQAHLMTNEAQNALLKSLEEPPADTVIILTAPASLRLKDTIYSRVQRIDVLPVSKELAASHFSAFKQEDIDKAYMMSGGQVGLMYSLLHDVDHELASQIKQAKQVLAADRYQKLLYADELAKQKETLPAFLYACKLICSTALHQSLQKNSGQSKRWHTALQAIHDAEAALPHNPNTKLLLTDLMLSL